MVDVTQVPAGAGLVTQEVITMGKRLVVLIALWAITLLGGVSFAEDNGVSEPSREGQGSPAGPPIPQPSGYDRTQDEVLHDHETRIRIVEQRTQWWEKKYSQPTYENTASTTTRRRQIYSGRRQRTSRYLVRQQGVNIDAVASKVTERLLKDPKFGKVSGDEIRKVVEKVFSESGGAADQWVEQKGYLAKSTLTGDQQLMDEVAKQVAKRLQPDFDKHTLRMDRHEAAVTRHAGQFGKIIKRDDQQAASIRKLWIAMICLGIVAAVGLLVAVFRR